jgi:hypothetical protein
VAIFFLVVSGNFSLLSHDDCHTGGDIRIIGWYVGIRFLPGVVGVTNDHSVCFVGEDARKVPMT